VTWYWDTGQRGMGVVPVSGELGGRGVSRGCESRAGQLAFGVGWMEGAEWEGVYP
jgi:hypothetical protein